MNTSAGISGIGAPPESPDTIAVKRTDKKTLLRRKSLDAIVRCTKC
jgi:hypothetical protein